jgi:hypothetical protein
MGFGAGGSVLRVCFFDDEGQLWEGKALGLEPGPQRGCSDVGLLNHLLCERGFIAFEETGD